MRNTIAPFLHLPRDLWIFLVSWGALCFAYFGILGVLFNLYLLRLNYGPEQIGLLTGMGQLVSGIAAIPAGLVGVRMGNRTALIWGSGLSTAMIALLLLGELLPTSIKHGWIATCWILSWVGSALIIVNSTPYIMEICEVTQRRSAFVLQQVVAGICGFFGSVVAGALPSFFSSLGDLGVDSSTSYWYSLWLAPVLYLAATVVMRMTIPLPPSAPVLEENLSAKLPLLIILFVGLTVFLQSSGDGTIRAFFNVYLDSGLQAPIARIGAVMGLGLFLPILSLFAAGWMFDRVGTGQTIVWAGAVAGFFMLLLAFYPNWIAASAGYIGILVAMSVATVARSLFSQEIVSPQWRTYMSSAFTIGLTLGWSLAAGAGGYVITRFGYSYLFALGAILAVLSTILLGAYLRLASKGRVSVPVTSQSTP
jgi:MFS family permease